MPRSYKRTPGSRKYADFNAEQLQECLEAVRSGQMSQRDAENHYKISRSTIKRRLKDDSLKKPGHPVVFNSDEELAFASHLDKVCDFGFPVDELDFRFIVKSYLAMHGRSVKCFKDNLPGRDWVKLFLKRQPQLSVRFANNIKRARAAIDDKVIIDFIDNLSDLVNDVPAENIYNYDETAMSDDPGKSKIICRRGCKYPERVINSTKSNVSVMFCGNAAGSSVPPYIIYKSEHLWTTWTENGPAGARYNRSKHGWIDLAIFEEWFSAHLLPVLKKQEGMKIIIGDNLSSHLSLNVVNLCQEHNVKFVCLPPNSSHLTQPLDVAYFRPLKAKWREVLTKWKQSDAGKRATSLPKEQFPMLLKTVLDELKPTLEHNLKTGFRKCGIFPINKDEILSRLPKQDRSVNLPLVGEAFLAHLDQKRLEFVKPKTKKKKIQVAPGKSICASDIQRENERCEKPKDNKKKVKLSNKKTVSSNKKSKKRNCDDSTSEDEDAYSVRDSGESGLDFSEESESEITNLKQVASTSDPNLSTTISGLKLPTCTSVEETLKSLIDEGNFVLVSWKNMTYPGLVMSVDDNGAIIDCMTPTKKGWKWPAEKDILYYNWCDIQRKINPPILQKRGLFSVQIGL